MQEGSGSPQLIDRRRVTRAGIAGAVLGIVGIGLFIAMWLLLGSMNVSTVIRLVVSVCVPPALISTFMGVYLLVTHSKNQ